MFKRRIKKFFSIGRDSYIPCDEVKAILSGDAHVAKKIIKNAKEKNVLYNVVPKNNKRLSIIWMFDDTVYLTGYKAQTLAKRAIETGTVFIKVGPELYLPVDHIKGIFPFGSTLATRVRTEKEEINSNTSFVRKSQRRKTSIFLADGEVISVAYSPNRVMERIGNAENSLYDTEVEVIDSKK